MVVILSKAWSKVYPKENDQEYNTYKELRIHDLWEKIQYEQLLTMLIEKLNKVEDIKELITLDEGIHNKDCAIYSQ